MTLTELLLFLLIGAIAGWAAGKLVRGAGMGLVANIIVGVIGAFLGGWLFSVLNIATGAGLIGSLITAIVGAVVLLWIAKLVS